MPAITTHQIKYDAVAIQAGISNNKFNLRNGGFFREDLSPYILIVTIKKGAVYVLGL